MVHYRSIAEIVGAIAITAGVAGYFRGCDHKPSPEDLKTLETWHLYVDNAPSEIANQGYRTAIWFTGSDEKREIGINADKKVEDIAMWAIKDIDGDFTGQTIIRLKPRGYSLEGITKDTRDPTPEPTSSAREGSYTTTVNANTRLLKLYENLAFNLKESSKAVEARAEAELERLTRERTQMLEEIIELSGYLKGVLRKPIK